MITTIGYDQEEIISDILTLHAGGGPIDVDPTYSKGNFYKNSIKEPQFKFDIEPKYDFVTKACATKLPLAPASVKTIMFDPPFLATKGPSLKKAAGNKINKRFGVFETEPALHAFYAKALGEFYRIAEPKGILIFKCQDKVSSGKQYFSHCFVYEQARLAGWYAKDLFVLMAKNRIVANWQRNQQHARKFHSYFWVFQKMHKNLCI